MNHLQILVSKYGISHHLAERLLCAGRVKRLAKGAFIVFKDQTVDRLTLPLDGRFGLSSSCNERASSIFSIITPGTALNEVQLLLGEQSLTDIKATEHSTVLQIPFSICHELLNECIEFSHFLNTSLAKKQRAFHALFQLRAMKSNKKKVYSALAVLAGISDSNTAVINLVNLASLLYMSRNIVSKEIKALIELGLLENAREGYWVLTADEAFDCAF